MKTLRKNYITDPKRGLPGEIAMMLQQCCCAFNVAVPRRGVFSEDKAHYIAGTYKQVVWTDIVYKYILELEWLRRHKQHYMVCLFFWVSPYDK